MPGHHFCNPKNVSTNPNKLVYEGFGWCCPELSNSVNCINGENNLTCTIGDEKLQGEPLYKTYWVGQTATVCNQTETGQALQADLSLQYTYASKFVIMERDAEEYEACYWTIAVEKEKYRNDTKAYIEINFEVFDNAEVHIYDGSGRTNATLFIEANATVARGAPYRAPISSQFIIVATTVPNGNAGSLSFSYIVKDAEEYEWFYKPFVGLERWIWYIVLGGVILSPVLLCMFCCCCCRHSSCFYDCCDCCVFSDCCRPKDKRKQKTGPDPFRRNQTRLAFNSKPTQKLNKVVVQGKAEGYWDNPQQSGNRTYNRQGTN